MTATQATPPPTVSMPTVRELGPHEGSVLDAVFAGLSTLSRFRRFHGAMPRMPATVRERLAAVDGRVFCDIGDITQYAEPYMTIRGPGRWARNLEHGALHANRAQSPFARARYGNSRLP